MCKSRSCKYYTTCLAKSDLAKGEVRCADYKPVQNYRTICNKVRSYNTKK